MERRDRLWNGGWNIIFDDELTKPGTDSFLLASFPKLKRGLRTVDLGAGVGIIGLLMLARDGSITVDNVEIMPQAAAMAQKNAEENGLSQSMRTHNADLKCLGGIIENGSMDLVVSNPPYFRAGSGRAADGDIRAAAREERLCTLEDTFASAAKLLRCGGHFCLVHRPERLADIMYLGRTYKTEPKRLRFVCDRAGRAPSLVLVDCAKGGKPDLAVEAPLILHNADGSETAEVDEIYFRGRKSL